VPRAALFEGGEDILFCECTRPFGFWCSLFNSSATTPKSKESNKMRFRDSRSFSECCRARTVDVYNKAQASL
jgi:hypothetical protein